MKRFFLLSLAFAICFATFAQIAKMKPGIQFQKATYVQAIGIEPERVTAFAPVKNNSSSLKQAPGIVTILDLGTAANPYTYAANVGGDQKTMVWADDNLKVLINIHRMGPGTAPPSLSGYYAVDLGVNMGFQTSDWTLNRQCYNAVMPGGTYYVDAGRYPQGGIYNPEGNTALENAYVAFFGPNTSNAVGSMTWGGYSRGTDNLVNQADSAKELYWYAPPPYTYIPDGFTIAKGGINIVTDFDQDWSSGSLSYQDNIIVNRGVWNSTAHKFDYSQTTLYCPAKNGAVRPRTSRVAASPDGQTVWIGLVGNNDGASNVDSAQYYPIFYKSIDAGLTWGNAIAVQLDGSTGLNGVINHLLSDNMIATLYDPPLPSRDQIPYTCAWDCDMAVDMWGNPHMGVIIGVAGSDAFSILTGMDSLRCVYDIYSIDGGTTWQAQKMGNTMNFDGSWGSGSDVVNEYNRTNIATNMTGDKMFFTWNDTQVTGATDNTQPDVFARGFDLMTNKITNTVGLDAANNVTFLSDVTQQAYWECTSHYIFTNDLIPPTKYVIPIVTVMPDDITNMTKPVSFKYISDFSYTDADFTIESYNPPFPVGVNESKKDIASISKIYPNPVKDIATVSMNLTQGGKLSIEIANLLGQRLMSIDKGNVNSGNYEFSIDASNLNAGVYFYTVKVNEKSYTNKMIVE